MGYPSFEFFQGLGSGLGFEKWDMNFEFFPWHLLGASPNSKILLHSAFAVSEPQQSTHLTCAQTWAPRRLGAQEPLRVSCPCVCIALMYQSSG